MNGGSLRSDRGRKKEPLDPKWVTPSRRPDTNHKGRCANKSSLRSRSGTNHDPTGWPHREDSKHTPGRWSKSLRSDRGLRQTRPGRVTPSRRLKAKTRSRGPEGAPFRNARRRAIGEVGGDPRPTDWRGRTTNSTPSAETQQGDQQRHVHGRETSSNAAMARPTGQNQSAPHYGRKQGEDWWPHAPPPENDGACSQRGLAKAATSPEELESSRKPDRCRTTREREKPRPNPGENTQERIGTKSNRTPPSRGLEDVKPTGTPTSFLEERCHHARQ